MNFTLKQLEIFYSCAHTMHFKKTAAILHLSPAAISKQISNLEDQLGFKLFEVIGRNVKLTAKGKSLLPQVEVMMQEVNSIKASAKQISATKLQPIKISFGSGLDNVVFNLIRELSNNNHEIKFEVIIHRNRKKQFNDLLNDKTNIHFATAITNDKRLTETKISKLDFFLAYAKQNNMQQKTNKDIIQQETFITISDEKPRAEKYNKSLLLESYPSVKEAILANLGFGFLPHNLIENDDRLLVIKKKPIFSKQLYLVTRKNTKNQSLELFQEFLFKNI